MQKEYLNRKATKINFSLGHICKEKGFALIDNKNIDLEDLWEDGLYLLKKRDVTLARSFIFFKQFLLTINVQTFISHRH